MIIALQVPNIQEDTVFDLKSFSHLIQDIGEHEQGKKQRKKE